MSEVTCPVCGCEYEREINTCPECQSYWVIDEIEDPIKKDNDDE